MQWQCLTPRAALAPKQGRDAIAVAAALSTGGLVSAALRAVRGATDGFLGIYGQIKGSR
jgi:hypothetical protein